MRTFATSISAVLLSILMLAACAREPAPPVYPRVSAERVESGRLLQLRVDNLRPGDSVGAIRLTGPAGESVGPVDRRGLHGTRGTHAEPSVGITAEGGSATGVNPGISLSLPLFDWVWGGPDREETRRAVLARLPLPKTARADPQAWALTVEITDATGRTETRRVPVPAGE